MVAQWTDLEHDVKVTCQMWALRSAFRWCHSCCVNSDSLDVCRAKLNRARNHQHEFDQVFEGFLAAKPYSLDLSFDPQSGWHDLRWRVHAEPPVQELSLIFGDVLTNLRSTLDYLVWQLVLVAGNEPSNRTSFPVATTSQGWASARNDQLQGVDGEWIEVLDGLQPYRQGSPDLHPLAILNRVNNINKHRTLPLGVVSTAHWRGVINVEPLPAGNQLEFDSFADDAIEEGGLLYRFRWKEEREQLEVPEIGDPTYRVLFVDDIERVWNIGEVFVAVGDALELFQPAFES